MLEIILAILTDPDDLDDSTNATVGANAVLYHIAAEDRGLIPELCQRRIHALMPRKASDQRIGAALRRAAAEAGALAHGNGG